MSFVLYAYRITTRTSTGKTSFSLAYEYEVMILVEVGMPNHRRAQFNLAQNDENLSISLNLIEEVMNIAQVIVAVYQQMVAKYYNSRVKNWSFQVLNLVIRKVMIKTKKARTCYLKPN